MAEQTTETKTVEQPVVAAPKFVSQLSKETTAQFAEELKSYAGKDVNDLFLEHAKLSKTVKERGIIVPTKDSPQEEIDAFHERMGLPKTAADYQFKFDDKVLPAQAVEEARKFVASNGYTQKQAQAYVSNLEAIARAGVEGAQRRRAEGEKNVRVNLVRELGGDEKAAEAAYNLAVKKISGYSEATREKLLNTGLAYDPTFLKDIAADQAKSEPHNVVLGDGATHERTEPKSQGKFGSGYSDEWSKLHGKKGG